MKINKSKNHQYVQLVESYREEGKVKHRTIYNFGRLDQLLEKGTLSKLGTQLLILGESEMFSTEEIQEKNRLIYGQVVYHRLWKKMEIDSILTPLLNQTKISFDLCKTTLYMVCHRLLKGSSKKQTYADIPLYLGQEKAEIGLQHLYRTLDFLATYKNKIEQQLYQRQCDLFHLKLDVVFYDVTTFHFESQKADDLRDFGFSKSCKFNEVQVVMGLLVNAEGRPIGHELFEGNQFEGTTLVNAIEKLSKRFNINKVVIVADKGINSCGNLHLIREAGYDYIVSYRLKTAKQTIKEQVFDAENWQVIKASESEQISYRYKTIDHQFTYTEVAEKTGEKTKHTYQDYLLLSWSADRAKADHKKRKRLVEKAESYLKNGAKQIYLRKGSKRYLKTANTSQIEGLDTSKIEQDAQWDGLYAIQYSGQQWSAQQVTEQYKMLWKIEESFRILKSTMNTRPVFHWTANRIKGHFMLCFIAFLLERTLEIKLKNNQVSLSPQAIKTALNSLQVSELEIRAERFLVKSNASTDAKKIMRAMKIKPLKNVTPKEELNMF